MASSEKEITIELEEERFTSPWKTCVDLSMGFWLVFTAFQATLNLQSSINHEDNLGLTSLGTLYTCFMVGAMLAPMSERLLGNKRIIQLSFALHLTFLISNFHPIFAVMVPCSGLLGLTLSPASMSMNLYLSEISRSYAFIKNTTPGEFHGILSMFNGLFYSFYKATHISGNLISSLTLFSSPVNSSILEENVCGAGLCSSSTNETLIKAPEQNVVWWLLGMFIVCNLLGSLIIACCLPPMNVPGATSEQSKGDLVVKHLSGCVRQASSFKFLLLLPFIMVQSMMVMIMYTEYTKAFVTCTIGVQWVGYSMVFLGFFAACSSLLTSPLVGSIGRLPTIMLGILIDLSTVFIMLLWTPASHGYKEILFLIPALAGGSEGILQPQISVLITDVFKENLPPAFAATYAIKCLGKICVVIVSALGCLYHQLYLALGLYVLGILGYLLTEYRERHKHPLSCCQIHLCRKAENDLEKTIENGEDVRLTKAIDGITSDDDTEEDDIE